MFLSKSKLKQLSTISLLGISALYYSQEKNLKNVTKLTFGGDNAEAYFSPNSKMLTMQVTNPEIGAQCDQIFLYDLTQKPAESNLKLVSTGKGRTTCSFFMPMGNISSMHLRIKPTPIARQNRHQEKTENIFGQSIPILRSMKLILTGTLQNN